MLTTATLVTAPTGSPVASADEGCADVEVVFRPWHLRTAWCRRYRAGISSTSCELSRNWRVKSVDVYAVNTLLQCSSRLRPMA